MKLPNKLSLVLVFFSLAWMVVATLRWFLTVANQDISQWALSLAIGVIGIAVAYTHHVATIFDARIKKLEEFKITTMEKLKVL